MAVKDMLKEWRIWLLFVVLAIAVAGLQPTYVSNNGEYDLEFRGLEDNLGIDFSGGSQLLMRVDSENQSEELVDEVASVLRIRVNEIGFGETSINTIDVGDGTRISLTTAERNESRIQDLISQQGAFEARMPFVFTDSGNFTLGEDYRFEEYDNSSVRVGRYTETGLEYFNDTVSEGEYIELEGTRMYYTGKNGSYNQMEAQIYDNTDILDVRTSESAVRESGRSSFEAIIPLVVSQTSAETLRDVANNYRGTQSLTMENGRPAELTLYIDGESITGFTVSSQFQREVITSPTITITRDSASEARDEMERIEALLQSGQLPAPVEVISTSSLGSSLGSQFMTASIMSIIGALIAVGFLVFIRYRNPKLVAPIVLTGASEVFILLGLWFTTAATLTLSAIAGIIAAVGTGVDDQIIITDESDRTSVKDWKARMKTAFFVIFTSAASTIGAMVPILSPRGSSMMVMAAGLGLIGYTRYKRTAGNHYLVVGGFALAVGAIATTFPLSPLQQIQEFATTTILGIMVGITITRPAYAKILEHMD